MQSLLEHIHILYEDETVVVINKPSGLVVHEDGKTEEPTVTDWVLTHYPAMKDVGEPTKLSNGEMLLRPGIVHRIDRETSGVLVLPKTQNSFLHIKAQFQEYLVQKTYRAFVYGPMGVGEGVIDRPIGRSKNDFRKWTAERGARGVMRDAVTFWKLLEETVQASYLEVYPKTGRTHQIRVHLKALNHPLVADSLYAPQREPILGFTRLALHAFSISFLPLAATTPVLVTAPFPADFLHAEKELQEHKLE